MFVWTGSAWVSVATEVESMANFATQSYADNASSIASGLKPIIPSSVTIGSGSSSVSTLGTVTFTGSSSVSLNDVFSSTYDNYKIVLDYTASTTITLTCRLRVSGADNSTSNYHRQYLDGNSTTASAGRNTGQTSWTIGAASASNRTSFTSDIFNPFLSVVTGATSITSNEYNASASLGVSLYTLGFNATTSFTGFSLIPSTGNITGTVSVYGYKK